MTLALLFLLAVASRAAKQQDDFDYVIAPKMASPGENVTAYVHILPHTQDQRSSVRVSARLQDIRRRIIASQGPKHVTTGGQDAFNLQLPQDLTPGTGYTLTVETHPNGGVGYNRSFYIAVRRKTKIIMIQTDKPIYKPGENVLGRIIVLDRNLIASTGSVMISIQNPKSYVMSRFANMPLDTGVAKFEFQLSEQPVLGTYKICATYEGEPQDQQKCFDFKVDRYVLPKFSCSVTPSDDVLLCTSRTACFTVTAKYSYGHNVKGKVEASADLSELSLQCRGLPNYFVEAIDGSTRVCVDVCSRNQNWCSGDVRVNVTVTDSASESTVRCEGRTSIPIRSRQNTMRIIDDEQVFHPCQYSTVKVMASALTGTPVSTSVKLIAEYTVTNTKTNCLENGGQLRSQQLYSHANSNGIATFKFCVPCNAVDLRLRAVPAGSHLYPLFYHGHSYRRMVYSPKKVVITSDKSSVEVGSVAKLTASFSAPTEAQYYVVCKGRIVREGQCEPLRDRKAASHHSQMCMEAGLSHSCCVMFEVTHDMVPNCTFFIFQKNEGAAHLNFDVQPDSTIRTSVTFTARLVRPGTNATIVITAPQNSLVGVVAVDQSVYFKQDKNQLTTAGLLAEAGSFDEREPLEQGIYTCLYSQNWHCTCRCYGQWPRSKGQPVRPPGPPGIKGATGNRGPPGAKGDTGVSGMNKRAAEGARGPPGSVGPLGPRGQRCCPRDVCAAPIRRQTCRYISAFSYFKAYGIHLSDLHEPSPRSCSTLPPRSGLPHIRNDCCFMKGIPGPAADGGSSDDGQLIGQDRVRSNFPETWLWFERGVGESGSFQETVTVPDTITSWVADGFAVSAVTPMSIAPSTTLTVFQRFFVTVNLPYSVIRGELVEITVTVFNYMSSALSVDLTMDVKLDQLRIVRSIGDRRVSPSTGRTVEVPAGDGKSVSYHVIAIKTGHLPIRVNAQSSRARDAVQRELLVEAEGVQQEYGLSSLMCFHGDSQHGSFGCVQRSFNVSLPHNYVLNSENAIASVTGDYMGPTISGLEKLLKLPTGCGEQNMVKFAPAVYITTYLIVVGKLDQATRQKALHYMQTGYQRQLTYQRTDGSYSAFGSDRCGSTWLTAFVVRSFGQAHGLLDLYIDPTVQKEAIDFLWSAQIADGSFTPRCQTISKEMQGCSGRECTLSAFVIVSLLEAGIMPTDKRLISGLSYLLDNCLQSDCSDSYTVALVAYALCKARRPEGRTLLTHLRTCAVTEGDHVHWQYSSSPACSVRSWSCNARSCDVEATAYALLAFACNGDIAYSLNIVRWLVEQRNPRGGFTSSQDTVVALQGLIEYAVLSASSGRVYGTVYLRPSTDGFRHSLRIDSTNALSLQTVKLPKIPTVISLRGCGRGCTLAQVNVKYNIPRPDATAAFAVDVVATNLKWQGACKYTVTVCNQWLPISASTSKMAITDITLLSGFLPVQEELEELAMNGKCQIKRVDTEGRHVLVYFEEVTRTRCCFSITMKRDTVVEDLKGVPVVSYSYYQPEQTGGTMLYPRAKC